MIDAMLGSVLWLVGIFEPKQIVVIVLALLIILFILGTISFIPKHISASLMVTVGILGTFWGISIALTGLDFSNENINDSITSLLNGMKTAFLTSLLGLLFAFSSKFIWTFGASIWTSIFGSKSTTPEGDIIKHLDAIKQAIAGEEDNSIVTQMKKLRTENRDDSQKLDAIKQAIAREGDSSLVTQIQKLRDENRSGFEKLDGLNETIRNALIQNLERLIEDIRDIIGKQLGDNLNALIKNIEEALIDQFGKTFGEFNQAVQALKKWQEDHRQQVEELTAAFKQTAAGIENIRRDCEKIPDATNLLAPILEAINTQVEDLTARLAAFADMKKQAEESFPVIKSNLDKIGEDLLRSAEGFETMEKTISEAFESSVEQVGIIATKHTKYVEEIAGKMQTTMEKAQQKAADKTEIIINAAAKNFAQAMEGEINRVTREWGGNLTSIAKECAKTIKAVEQLQRNEP